MCDMSRFVLFRWEHIEFEVALVFPPVHFSFYRTLQFLLGAFAVKEGYV